jgi:hypothetical protein
LLERSTQLGCPSAFDQLGGRVRIAKGDLARPAPRTGEHAAAFVVAIAINQLRRARTSSPRSSARSARTNVA